MRRLGFAVVIVACAISSANAADNYQDWVKYFAGKWITVGGGPEAQWDVSLVAKGHCGIGTMKDAEGEESGWIIGWDAHEKRLTHEWFTDNGGHGCVPYEILDDKTIRGPATIHSTDGVTKATVTVKKSSNRRFTVHWTDVTANGEAADDVNIVVEKKQ